MMSIVLTLDLTILNKMSLDFFQLGWLKNSITEIGNAASNPLMFNHPKWNPPQNSPNRALNQKSNVYPLLANPGNPIQMYAIIMS